jgi:ribulose-phosphate 3-epimerase
LHLDVMDGHFVPNISYGLPIVEAVRRASSLPIEAHLMISDPGRYAQRFVAAGADAITFHVEAEGDPRALLEDLRSLGVVAGLAFNPETPVSAISDYLDVCDLVLVMSVSPGFGGQSFERVALEKLRHLRGMNLKHVLLEVDGGVNDKTIAECAAAGARLLVVGSAIFGQPDYTQAISTLTGLANPPSRTH